MAHIHRRFCDVDDKSELCSMKMLHFAMKIFMEMYPIPPAAPSDDGKIHLLKKKLHFLKFLDWNRA